MVVDDDASMGQAIVRVLRAGGFAATVFTSAETALEADEAAIRLLPGVTHDIRFC
jgi:FixJ family two-component response regulator